MEPRKIGIITCSNCTQDLDCCSISCLRDIPLRAGKFDRYPADEPLQLGGIISCAGCPTAAYPEKILRKVKALTEYGILDIHFANCMMFLCPFVKRYAQTIREAFPEVTIVEGTHLAHNSPEQFRCKVKTIFEDGRKMPDIVLQRL